MSLIPLLALLAGCSRPVSDTASPWPEPPPPLRPSGAPWPVAPSREPADLALPGPGIRVLDVASAGGRVHVLCMGAGRQFLHAPGRAPLPLPDDFEAHALAVGLVGSILVGGEWEGPEGEPRAVLAFEGGQGWVRPRVPPGAGAVEDVAAGPEPTAFVAVGRATLADGGGYALVTRDPGAGFEVRAAPVPLLGVVTTGWRYVARGSDGSLWTGNFLAP